MSIPTLITDALAHPPDGISYFVSRELAAAYPGRAIIEGSDYGFDLEDYHQAELCTLRRKPDVHNQVTTNWNGTGRGVSRKADNAWFEVSWEGHQLDVLWISWREGHCRERHFWIMADAREVADRFLITVCDWCSEVRGEVLVFDQGQWYKSEQLYQAIQNASFDNLILGGTLKDSIREDFNQFFTSRDLYERYGIPWKRGILLVGPPGNGKTHTVKSLINWLEKPCLYVKSFTSSYGTPHANIHAVFERARQTTPCVLVFEDLDALITPKNRSFFLNELDGFAANAGIVVLATTNHPERLDPAIVNRPSRFDRTYRFELPALDERRDYLSLWNVSVEPDVRLTEDGLEVVAELTDQFSFAYLKELWISSLSRWIASPNPGAMDEVMKAQVGPLREQMSAAVEESVPILITEEMDEEDD
jgi:hypothetical protein